MFDATFLKIPIHLWDSRAWSDMQKGLLQQKLMRQDEEILAMCMTDSSGIACIAFPKKVWRKANNRERGFLLSHELLHLVRNQGKLRGRKEEIEEEIIGRFMPRSPLRASTYSDGIVLKVRSR